MSDNNITPDTNRSGTNQEAWREQDAEFRGRETQQEREPEFNEDADLPALNRRRNNRFITWLGFGVIALLGIAMLYAALTKPKQATVEPEKRVSNRLPQLTVPEFLPPPEPPAERRAAASAPMEAASSPEEDIWARKMGGGLVMSGSGAAGGAPGGGPQRNMTESERMAYLLSMSAQGRGAAGQPAGAGSTSAGAGGGNDGGAGSSGTRLGAALQGTDTVLAKASALPNRDFILTKGTALDCALETALNSSVPGLATCRLTRDVYSDNGRVLLLDRGSQLVGEYQGGMRTGQKRMFLLWNRVKTPAGVVVKLDSPGTDALGRGGMGGHIDNHFWERFGSAILTSLVTDGIQVVFDNQRSGRGNGNTNIYMSTANAGAEVVKQMLEQSSNIPPTLVVNQGAHVSILVARDLDFSGVYSLQVR